LYAYLRRLAGLAALAVATGLVLSSSPGPANAAIIPAPEAPENLRAVSVGFDTVALEWTRVPSDGPGDDVYYRILVNGVWRDSSREPRGSLSSLKEGTSYDIEVRSVDIATQKVSPAASITVKTLSDREAPSTPRNLRADATGLRWDPSTDNRGVAGYFFYVDGQHVRSTTATELEWNLLEYMVIPGQKITVAVQAVDLSGLASSLSSTISVTAL
jgi:chitinase